MIILNIELSISGPVFFSLLHITGATCTDRAVDLDLGCKVGTDCAHVLGKISTA